MMHTDDIDVTVCVPAYNASPFIIDTFESVSAQTYPHFELLISVDKSSGNTLHVIEEWCNLNKDIKGRVFAQSTQLGWVGNMNFLLENCETRYFWILPHDDLLHHEYLEKLTGILKANPTACAAYSDVQGFGKKTLVVIKESLSGETSFRVEQFLKKHFSAVSLRAVVNREIISDQLELLENDCDNFAADTIWVLQQALRGDLIRVPEVLYYKRYTDDSVHDRWQTWNDEQRSHVWITHCRDCLNFLLNKYKTSIYFNRINGLEKYLDIKPA